jgi:hypothetical protein
MRRRREGNAFRSGVRARRRARRSQREGFGGDGNESAFMASLGGVAARQCFPPSGAVGRRLVHSLRTAPLRGARRDISVEKAPPASIRFHAAAIRDASGLARGEIIAPEATGAPSRFDAHATCGTVAFTATAETPRVRRTRRPRPPLAVRLEQEPSRASFGGVAARQRFFVKSGQARPDESVRTRTASRRSGRRLDREGAAGVNSASRSRCT